MWNKLYRCIYFLSKNEIGGGGKLIPQKYIWRSERQSRPRDSSYWGSNQQEKLGLQKKGGGWWVNPLICKIGRPGPPSTRTPRLQSTQYLNCCSTLGLFHRPFSISSRCDEIRSCVSAMRSLKLWITCCLTPMVLDYCSCTLSFFFNHKGPKLIPLTPARVLDLDQFNLEN